MHVEKYTRSATGHMLAHYTREKDENGKYVTDGRKNIYSDKTPLNYSVGNHEMAKERLQWYLSRDDVKCLNRKDVNVMCDVVVTVPQDLPKEQHKLFFEASHSFLCQRYGIKTEFGNYDNILCSEVHLDETTPHMHFAFIPVVKEKKIDKKTQEEKTIYRVNAKKVVSRSDLRTLHPDMSDVMKKTFGRDIGIENGITKQNGGNQTVEQLKYKTALENEIKALEKRLESQNKTISDKESKITQLNNKMADMVISDELHIALTEKQQILKQANTDLNKLETGLTVLELDEMIKKWDCGIMPVIEKGGAKKDKADKAFNELVSFLRNLIETIKEFFSMLLGESYQKELLNIQKDLEQDEWEIEK